MKNKEGILAGAASLIPASQAAPANPPSPGQVLKAKMPRPPLQTDTLTVSQG